MSGRAAAVALDAELMGAPSLQLLQVVGDDAVAGLEPALDNPVVAVLRAERDVDDVHIVVRRPRRRPA